MVIQNDILDALETALSSFNETTKVNVLYILENFVQGSPELGDRIFDNHHLIKKIITLGFVTKPSIMIEVC